MGLFSRTLSRLDELKRALTRDPASRQFLALADEHRKQGQVPEAIDVLERGLSQNPGAVAGHVALGRLLQQDGRAGDALSAFQAALKLDPQNLVAIRQAAEVHLSKGEKVEAIKRLKLFRGLNPGDREVNEIIRQLDGELGVAPAGRVSAPAEAVPLSPALSPPREVPAAPPLPAPAPALAVPAVPPVPRFPEAAPAPAPVLPAEAEFALRVAAMSPASERAAAALEPPGEPEPFGATEVFSSFPEPEPTDAEPPARFQPSTNAGSGEAPADAGGLGADEAAVVVPPVPVEESPGQAAPASRRGAGAPPAVTETLAELLRAQGHLADAQEAYRELALAEPDSARSRRFLSLADEVATQGARTARGRLEAWVEPFARHGGEGEVELLAAVEETVDRLGGAAVVTDLEGVPVVSAGPRSEAEAMESLAAELTAFWKNVRRSRTEIGEGALDSLVLTGSAGTAAVKLITPAYALLLKTGPGIPAGRIRFEAARAAEHLRPALL